MLNAAPSVCVSGPRGSRDDHVRQTLSTGDSGPTDAPGSSSVNYPVNSGYRWGI